MNRVIKNDHRVSTIEPTEFKLDTSLVSVFSVITTETRDRSQDIVLSSGVILDNHARNPVVLLEHEHLIGKAATPDGLYTVEKHPGFITATTYFDQENPLSMEVFRLIDRGILKGTSIGFVVRKAKIIEADDPEVVQLNKIDGDRVPVTRFGILYKEVELVEYTHTVIGDNPDALTVAVQKGYVGSEAMSPIVKAILTPHIIECKTQVSVPADVPTEQKAMAEDYQKEPDKEKPDGDKPDPKPDAKPDEKPEGDKAADTMTTTDLPPGAQLLDGLYTRALEMAAYLDEAGSSQRQENPEILAFVEDMVAQLDAFCSHVSDSFDSIYPDQKSLNGGADEPDGDEANPDEKPDEDDPEASEGKKIRQRLAARIEAYRKSRVGLKPAELPAVDKAELQAKIDHINAELKTLTVNYGKLLKQKRTGRF